MKHKSPSQIKLLKELQIIQESPTGVKMIYTVYEAIPNGGFCILSAEPDTGINIKLKRSSYMTVSKDINLDIPTLFFPTLIDAINAYSIEAVPAHDAC